MEGSFSELQAVIYLVNKYKTVILYNFNVHTQKKYLHIEYYFKMTPRFCDQGVFDNMQSRFPTVGGGSGYAVDIVVLTVIFIAVVTFLKRHQAKHFSQRQTRGVIHLYLCTTVIGLQHNQWSCNGVRFLN